MMLFGSLLKFKCKSDITPDMRNKAKSLIRHWYADKIEHDDYYNYLLCDYGPCGNLYDILKNAGINERNIRNICPWKTWAKIDKIDNTVLVCDGYNNYKTL